MVLLKKKFPITLVLLIRLMHIFIFTRWHPLSMMAGLTTSTIRWKLHNQWRLLSQIASTGDFPLPPTYSRLPCLPITIDIRFGFIRINLIFTHAPDDIVGCVLPNIVTVFKFTPVVCTLKARLCSIFIFSLNRYHILYTNYIFVLLYFSVKISALGTRIVFIGFVIWINRAPRSLFVALTANRIRLLW